MEQTGTIYNTNNMVGQELTEMSHSAKAQETAVIKFFTDRVADKAGASTIWNVLKITKRIDQAVPLTSIRRAVSTLTKQGKLVKTDDMSVGVYGKREYMYSLNSVRNDN